VEVDIDTAFIDYTSPLWCSKCFTSAVSVYLLWLQQNQKMFTTWNLQWLLDRVI